MALLNPGSAFPDLRLEVIGGGSVSVRDELAGHFGVVLIYRGSWCPYCNAQLRAFQRAQDSLAALGAKVLALSVDDEATTKDLVDKLRLTFSVGHSADAHAVAEATGAFVNPDLEYLQSTGFVLDPSGNIVVSVYSSGAIGRLVPEDLIGLIECVRDHAAREQAA